ncbi:manganese efflux pump MntP [Salinicola avicenniae]|uniref:manganese efflux pump MntP n=1 Tax=Salinicola avicenniae TaxID=2916836 RepID=UPI002074269B|nr:MULTISPECIES: manganese efflux pump MntP [unclassified Salinicola]
MNPASFILLAFAMSTDAFAASVGKGAALDRTRVGEALRIGAIFGAIESITPVIGWALGMVAARYIAEWDHWVAFVLLGGLGLHMVWSGLQVERQGDKTPATSRRASRWGMAATALATSIDAMAVGVTLAFTDVNIVLVAATIGLATMFMVTIGILLGRAIGSIVGKRAEVLGGLVLVGIGATVLYEHLSTQVG